MGQDKESDQYILSRYALLTRSPIRLFAHDHDFPFHMQLAQRVWARRARVAAAVNLLPVISYKSGRGSFLPYSPSPVSALCVRSFGARFSTHSCCDHFVLC